MEKTEEAMEKSPNKTEKYFDTLRKFQNSTSEMADKSLKLANEACKIAEKSLKNMEESLKNAETVQHNDFINIESSRIKFYDMAMSAIENNDYKTACDLLIQSSEPQTSKDMYNWGVMFFKGLGVPKNIDRAIKWYKKAADNAYINAYLVLGALYYMGEDVPENIPLAVELFQKASDAGDEQSKEILEAISSSDEKVNINLV